MNGWLIVWPQAIGSAESSQARSKPALGTDLRAFYDGKISVSPLHIDLTHGESVHKLQAVLGGTPPRA